MPKLLVVDLLAEREAFGKKGLSLLGLKDDEARSPIIQVAGKECHSNNVPVNTEALKLLLLERNGDDKC